MDTTIRNIDTTVYRSLKARAALEGRSIGELVSDAMRLYLLRPEPEERNLSILDWKPRSYSVLAQNLSGRIDSVLLDETRGGA